MKHMKPNKKQMQEMARIASFFMECVEPISNRDERHIVAAKIMSHLGCYSDRLVGHLNKKQKWEESEG